ncbi:2-dehydropantoate 2-reductase N-terminal domain-containing protein, partial [Bacillus sp. HC-Mk]
MKIGIVGPGAIGLLYTFYLQKSNQDVTLFTRTAKQAEELNETGVTCIRDGRCETVYPSVLPIESMVAQNLDYIFISVKQYHIDDVLPFVEAMQLSQIETYIEEWHECYLSELKK